jgi:opacity protein-like surface antigen
MAKGVLPLEVLLRSIAGWSLYGKLGAAIAIAHYKCEMTGVLSSEEDVMNQINAALVPTYAIGVAYNFTDHFGLDLSWTGIYSKKKLDDTQHRDYSATPRANFIALGISYKF